MSKDNLLKDEELDEVVGGAVLGTGSQVNGVNANLNNANTVNGLYAANGLYGAAESIQQNVISSLHNTNSKVRSSKVKSTKIRSKINQKIMGKIQGKIEQ